MTAHRPTGIELQSVVALALVAAIGCSDPAGPADPTVWGSPQASVTILPTSAEVTFLCGGGTINAALHTGLRESWSAAGVFYTGGGPLPIGGGQEYEATYSGIFNGDLLTFSVSVPDIDATLGPFKVRKGEPGPSIACL